MAVGVSNSGRRLASTVLVALVASLGMLVATAPVAHAAAAYVPMQNPSSNLTPNPDFFGATANCTTTCVSTNPCMPYDNATGQFVPQQNAACTAYEMLAINNAQQQLGEPAITLPSNWQQLSNPQRLFVFLSLERVSLGLPPYFAMDASLTTAAQQAAQAQTDPALPANWPLAYASNGYSMFGGAWSGGYSGMGTLAAYFDWLYDDGWDSATNSSSNYACTGPNSTGCWAHRDELLGETDYGTAPTTWGTGLYCTTCVVGTGSADGDASTTVLVATPSVPDSQLNLQFSWAAETFDVLGPAVSAISPSTGPTTGGTTVAITGSGFSTAAGATTVDFGSAAATAVSCSSTTSCTATSPAGTVDAVDVTVTTSYGTSTTSPADQFTYFTTTASAYTALAPTRLLDTRTDGRTLGPNSSLNLTVTGGSVPGNATAVALNVTATNTTGSSYLSVFPAGGIRPLVSNLNWSGGETVPNLVIVPVGANGQVSIYNELGQADVVVDLEGYFAPEESGSTQGSYVPLPPARITDTRPNSGEPNAGATLGPAGTLNVQVTGMGGVPSSGVSAVVLNVTVTDTTAAGFLTVFPQGSGQPVASNLNWSAGDTVANRVVVPVNPTTGQITVYNELGNTDVVIDVNGYFTNGSTIPTGASLFTPIFPIRLLDTRQTGQALGPGEALSQPMAAVDGIPTGTVAVATNVTAVNTTSSSFFTVYPGGSRPLASDVNWTAGEIVPNLTLATLSGSGAASIYNSGGSVDVVVDAFGYFSPG